MKALRRIPAILVLCLAMIGVTAPLASATVKYSYGGNIFTTIESWQLKYTGTGQITAQTWYGNYWTYKGYVAYSRDGVILKDDYTPVACTQTSSGVKWVQIVAWDSLNPKASVTTFNYNYWTAYRNSVVC